MTNKKYIFILLLSLATFLHAKIETDIALTIGYNKFDDPEFLKKADNFYGVRAGIYKNSTYGLQLGYEKAKDVNCQSLHFKRTYLNMLMISNQPHQFNPYGVVTVGYENSNIHRFKPSQAFVGAGIGVKKSLPQNLHAFVESRVLKKLKSHDTDVITTLGIGYTLKK